MKHNVPTDHGPTTSDMPAPGIHLSRTALRPAGAAESGVPCPTDENEAAEATQLASEMLQSILSKPSDCFVSITETGEIISISDTVEAMFGSPPNDVIGCNITTLIPSLCCRYHEQAMQGDQATTHPTQWQHGGALAGQHKTKGPFPVELSLTEIATPDGPLFIGILHDITERKQTQENLRLAKEAAEAASRAKSDFLANMSHELTTPLNFILGFADVLLAETAGPLTAKQRDYITRIRGGGNRLNNLLNDILDLSRVEAGATTVSQVSFTLGELLRACLLLHQEKAFKHGVTLALDTDAVEALPMATDPVILKKILFQLLANAMKFTPDGGTISLRAAPEPGHDGFVMIAVIDSGIGIAATDMPKLFMKFCQLESPFTKKYEGTGLGLALTKQLVELLGGTIRATSSQGQGSCFTVSLPCAASASGPGDIAPPA